MRVVLVTACEKFHKVLYYPHVTSKGHNWEVPTPEVIPANDIGD
jgi:hypothetical protein